MPEATLSGDMNAIEQIMAMIKMLNSEAETHIKIISVQHDRTGNELNVERFMCA